MRTYQKFVVEPIKMKYMYQEEQVFRTTYIYEQAEQTQDARKSIAKFVSKLDEKDAWLKTYLYRQYQKPYEDGQTDREYMIHRCNRHLGQTEMERSWKKQ